MQHITWTITFDRQWVNERLVAEDRRVPRDEEEWVRVMSRLQTAMDNCTAGESIDEAISGVVGTLEQHDYNVCPNTESGQHEPVATYQHREDGRLSVECQACGLGTSCELPVVEMIEWN